MKNKITSNFLAAHEVSEETLRDTILGAKPDCHEALLVCEFASNAVLAINALEMELEHYRSLADDRKIHFCECGRCNEVD